MKIISALLFLLLFSSQVLSESTGYEVELIIFEDVHGRFQKSEDWTYNDNFHNNLLENQSDDQKTTTKPDPEYAQLDWTQGSIAEKRQVLERNSNYRVLVNKRWKQTGLDRDQAFDVQIDSLAEPPRSDESQEQQVQQNLTPSYISGTVKLIMSRYLHFSVNLDYYRPQMDQQADYQLNVEPVSNQNESVYRKYPVIEERRMRSREVHYIDHPMVGVIVVATPYKIADKEGEPQAQPGTTYKTL